MNRIRRLVRPQRAGLHWKSALPLLGVGALCLAVYAQAMPAPRTQAPSHALAAVAPVEATAVAAAVAPEAGDRATWSVDRGQPYALVRDGKESLMLSGTVDDMAEVRKARLHLHGDFLWFRRDGAGYVVQDPALIAEARQAWAPSGAVGAKLEALGEQMKPHAQKMEVLGKQMERVAAVDRPQRERMEAISRQMQPLAGRQQALGEQMRVVGERMAVARDERERDELTRQMDALSRQMEPLSAQMSVLGSRMGAESGRLREMHAPMERLGAQMREAGEPMRELGEKMKVLGEEQERLAHQADARVQQLIERALREGKAERAAHVSAE